MQMLLGPALPFVLYLFVQCSTAETNNEAIRSPTASIDQDSPMRQYLRQFYDNPQLYVPRLQTNEILAKRAVLPYSGGIYGKRAALPFSGGIYGKRSQPDSALGDLLSDHVSVEIRAMPMNGGFFG